MVNSVEPFMFWESLPVDSWVLIAVAVYLAVIVGLGAWHIRKERRNQPTTTNTYVVSRIYTADDLAEIVELEKAMQLEWREDTRP